MACTLRDDCSSGFNSQGAAEQYIRSRSLDFESIDDYSLNVYVEDDGPGSEFNVCVFSIHICNVNENPKLVLDGTDISVFEHSALGTSLMKLHVVDPEDAQKDLTIFKSSVLNTISNHPVPISFLIFIKFRKMKRCQVYFAGCILP